MLPKSRRYYSEPTQLQPLALLGGHEEETGAELVRKDKSHAEWRPTTTTRRRVYAFWTIWLLTALLH